MNDTIQINAGQPATRQVERRKYVRVQVAIPVEFVPDGSEVATHAQTSDISLGGCYVEMNFTLPVGTVVEMALWLGEEKVWVSAKTVTSHPYFGNGFAFVDISDKARQKLAHFLSSLATAVH